MLFILTSVDDEGETENVEQVIPSEPTIAPESTPTPLPPATEQPEPDVPTPAPVAVACLPVPNDTLEAIASGLTAGPDGRLTNGHALLIPEQKRNSAGFPEFFVTARIEATGMTDNAYGIWAVGGDGALTIWPLDGLAIEFSDWLSAATDGSPADQSRDLLASYDERFAISDCQ